MADFDISFRILSDAEGGYANDPDDKGGETYRGISRNDFPSWEGWIIVDSFKNKPNFPKNLRYVSDLGKMVYTFYKKEFWSAIQGDNIRSQRIADKLLDMSAPFGVTGAVKCLQRAIHSVVGEGCEIKDDGVLGSRTLLSLNNKPEYSILPAFKSECAGKFRRIGTKKYLAGWLNRAYS